MKGSMYSVLARQMAVSGLNPQGAADYQGRGAEDPIQAPGLLKCSQPSITQHFEGN